MAEGPRPEHLSLVLPFSGQEQEIMPSQKSKTAKIVGSAYRQPKSLVKKYAKEDFPVLFIGETGCGKELFALYYMKSSGRTGEGEQRTVNCAAIAEGVLESEVFGHVKGAFTGAVKPRDGLIRTCDKGILFLDELGAATRHFQAAILRVSEGNDFRKVGSDEKEDKSDTLIIAATNSPNGIRDDLKYRFHVLPIPPLQRFDIPVLAEHFLEGPLKQEVLDELKARDYPGNVRELKKTCERLKVERGDHIFDKRRSASTEVNVFDYARFEMEYMEWHQHIQPLIDKYGLDFKYRYLSQDENQEHQAGFLGLTVKMLNLMERLGAGDKDMLPEFIKNLEAHFEKCELPNLLIELRLRSLSSRPTRHKKPDLRPLLDLDADEAKNQFELLYYNYHLQQHSNNKQKTARAVGLNERTFINRLDRARKKARKMQESNPPASVTA